jgi:hypothetical protein
MAAQKSSLFHSARYIWIYRECAFHQLLVKSLTAAQNSLQTHATVHIE